MGCGKSTIGAILANVLGWDFMDLDKAIEVRAGQSIPELFAQYGEAHFRVLESEALRATGNRKNLIVALGGGALVQPKNLQWALENALVIYVELGIDALVARLKHATTRPLLLDDAGNVVHEDELRARISRMLDGRRAFYEQAHLRLRMDGRSVGESVDLVAKSVRNAIQ